MNARLALWCAFLSAPLNAQTAPAKPQQSPCSTAEYRQFDFWAGDWDAYDVDRPATVVARARVDTILGGCVLREVYDGANGLSGQSFSVYDATRSVWHQSWVTNRGQLLTIEGKMEGDQMILTGLDRSKGGSPVQLRGVWKRVEGGVRETAHTSADGGKSWQPLFDLVFRPHKS
jgi:hypothetical protein